MKLGITKKILPHKNNKSSGASYAFTKISYGSRSTRLAIANSIRNEMRSRHGQQLLQGWRSWETPGAVELVDLQQVFLAGSHHLPRVLQCSVDPARPAVRRAVISVCLSWSMLTPRLLLFHYWIDLCFEWKMLCELCFLFFHFVINISKLPRFNGIRTVIE